MHLLNRRMGDPQDPSGDCSKEKILSLPEIEFRSSSCSQYLILEGI
jgi:hypothetical protein